MDPTVERVVPVGLSLAWSATADAVADAPCAHRVVGVVPEPSTVGGPFCSALDPVPVALRTPACRVTGCAVDMSPSCSPRVWR
jgi:hypothetical protein